MAVYMEGKALIIQEVPDLPEGCEAQYTELDVQDETNGKWWGLYELDGTIYRGRAHSEI